MMQEEISETAQKFGITPEQAAEILSDAKEKLFEVRKKRPKPHLDTKMLTAWNGVYFLISKRKKKEKKTIYFVQYGNNHVYP